MSAFFSNAECGPSNALSQLQKYNEADRSLQLDRVAGPSGSRVAHLPPFVPSPALSSTQAAAAVFFAEQNAPVPSHASHRQEMPQNILAGSEWTQEFPRTGTSSHLHIDMNHTGVMEAALLRAQAREVPDGYRHSILQSSAWSPEFGKATIAREPSTMLHQPLSRVVEFPRPLWDQEFSRMDIQPRLHDAKGKSKVLNPVDSALDEAFARVALQPAERGEGGEPDQRDFRAEFESVWTHIHESAGETQASSDLASWEADFHAAQSGNFEAVDPEWDFSEMERKYRELTVTQDIDEHVSSIQYDADGLPDLGDYEFEAENPYLSADSRSRLTSLLQESLASSDPSALTRSALILEAMLQLRDSEIHDFQLWYTLGQVLVRDERDDKGIKALSRAVKESAGQAGADSAILELAIAYINQSYDMACFLTLLRYLHSAYPLNTMLPTPEVVRGQAIWSARDLVKDAFLSLAQEQNSKGSLDPEIQMGLGVLLYSEAEYERAAECFQAALSINPENAVLWNRLGSCLSNGNRPEEAIAAYQRALEIWPNYTRAVVNIGVACLNMGVHKEAAEHFLSAIAMHDGTASHAATNKIPRGLKSNEDIWRTLRRTFLAMNRHDLAERALAPDRTADSFRAEGFEF